MTAGRKVLAQLDAEFTSQNFENPLEYRERRQVAFKSLPKRNFSININEVFSEAVIENPIRSRENSTERLLNAHDQSSRCPSGSEENLPNLYQQFSPTHSGVPAGQLPPPEVETTQGTPGSENNRSGQDRQLLFVRNEVPAGQEVSHEIQDSQEEENDCPNSGFFIS